MMLQDCVSDPRAISAPIGRSKSPQVGENIIPQASL